MKILWLSALLSINVLNAQVDTSDWFPMQVGNYWEYAAQTITGWKYFSEEFVGDTLMPNGQQYFIYYMKYFNTTDYDYMYLREDSKHVYRYYPDSLLCSEREFKYLDFNLPDSTIWLNCSLMNNRARGIASTFIDYNYYTFLNKPNLAKQFEDVYVDSADTIWTPSDGSLPIVLNQGLGIVWHFKFNDGEYFLQGAIINGIRMGEITDVNDEKNQIPSNFKLSIYPNPFNSSTMFEIYLEQSGQYEFEIYNVLGEKITTVFNEYKLPGKYSIPFRADNLASGMYIALVRNNHQFIKEKLLLLK